jgi:hypothetical protein
MLSILQQKSNEVDASLFDAFTNDINNIINSLRIKLISTCETFKIQPKHIKHHLDKLYQEVQENVKEINHE